MEVLEEIEMDRKWLPKERRRYEELKAQKRERWQHAREEAEAEARRRGMAK